MLALEGITILDLSGGYPPSFGTRILADMGADVINIEGRPKMAKQSAEEERREAAYRTANRNKKSVILNMKTEEARQVFYKLAEKADVIVDPFRPGVAKRLGIDYDTISKINPRIIYCSLSGFGQDGPYSHLPAHDVNFIALGGVLNLVGEAGRRPVQPMNLVADLAGAALHGTIGILIAIIARERTGRG